MQEPDFERGRMKRPGDIIAVLSIWYYRPTCSNRRTTHPTEGTDTIVGCLFECIDRGGGVGEITMMTH